MLSVLFRDNANGRDVIQMTGRNTPAHDLKNNPPDNAYRQNGYVSYALEKQPSVIIIVEDRANSSSLRGALGRLLVVVVVWKLVKKSRHPPRQPATPPHSHTLLRWVWGER